MCRNIKTTQERRASQNQWAKDQDFLIYAKIRRTNLPNIIRQDWQERSWKRHRKTQYHIIDVG